MIRTNDVPGLHQFGCHNVKGPFQISGSIFGHQGHINNAHASSHLCMTCYGYDTPVFGRGACPDSHIRLPLHALCLLLAGGKVSEHEIVHQNTRMNGQVFLLKSKGYLGF